MNTIVNSTCTDDGIIEINADMIFNGGVIHVCITDDAVCFSQNCIMADVNAMLDRTIENANDTEAYDWLDKHWDMFDRMDGIKYYQNFQGFKHTNNPYDVFLSETECIDVIEFVAGLIDEHKLNPETYDDDSSWYNRVKVIKQYKKHAFLKQIYKEPTSNQITMHDGNLYTLHKDAPGSMWYLQSTLTGEILDIVERYVGDGNDEYVFEVITDYSR